MYQSSASVVRHIRDLTLPSKSSNRDVCLVLSVYTFASFTCLKRSPERGSCCHASFGGHAEFLVLVLSPMFGMTADFVRSTHHCIAVIPRIYTSISCDYTNCRKYSICRVRYSKYLKKHYRNNFLCLFFIYNTLFCKFVNLFRKDFEFYFIFF